MTSIARIEQGLQTIDVTKLVEYTRKIKDIGSISNMMIPIYMRDFIVAYDVTNTMLAIAMRYDLEAGSALDTARAVAYLDRAGDYLASKGIKDSAESRKRYVEIDDEVKIAQSVRAKTQALCMFLKNKMQEFRMAHDDVKKIGYADSYQSPNEGF